MADLYTKTKLPDMAGDYYILWNTTGRDGKPMHISRRPIRRTSYDRALVVAKKFRYDKLRTLSNRDYHEIDRGTATLNKTTGAIVHHATDLVE